MNRKNVTVEIAIEKLITGLRAIPDGFSQCGCASSRPAIRKAHCESMVAWGRQFADKLASSSIEDAMKEIRRNDNKIVNLDPQGWHLGSWAHVARMVAAGDVYTMVDGVLSAKGRK